MSTLFVSNAGEFHPASDSDILSEGVEAAKRAFKPGLEFSTPKDAKTILTNLLATKRYEVFCVAFMNVQRQLIAFEEMSKGTIDKAMVYPREVAKRALELDAKNVILVHNHPSGASEPSDDDINMTEEVEKGLNLFDIQLLDHFVVGASGEMTSVNRIRAKQYKDTAIASLAKLLGK